METMYQYPYPQTQNQQIAVKEKRKRTYVSRADSKARRKSFVMWCYNQGKVTDKMAGEKLKEMNISINFFYNLIRLGFATKISDNEYVIKYPNTNWEAVTVMLQKEERRIGREREMLKGRQKIKINQLKCLLLRFKIRSIILPSRFNPSRTSSASPNHEPLPHI